MVIKVVVGVVVVILALVILYLVMMRGPDLSEFERLRKPEIAIKSDQKMLVVRADGDPNEVGGEAFGLLFKLYFRIKGAPRGPKQPAPRARWPVSLDVAPSEDGVPSEWVGHYAMPVPDHVTEVPEHEAGAGLEVELVTWVYGEVAEILHVGPYSEETPTIERLHAFIEESGYEIIGDHEEEYLRGPGMPFIRVRPEDYYTIIRYQVRKAQ
jgi:hypothetical protein